MKISQRTLSENQIFDINGNISFEETAEMESLILKNIAPGIRNVVVNLDNSTYITSSALGSFVRIHQTIKEKGITLSMMNLSKEVDNLFKITGVNRYFKYIPSENDLK
jgi:anti-anti-sigma factor